MTNENCIKLINIEQVLRNLLKEKSKSLEKEIFSLKFEILLLIHSQKEISPTKITKELMLAKSNVATFCKTLMEEGKIEMNKSKKDKRSISYTLSKKGQKYVSTNLAEMSKLLGEEFGDNLLKIEKNANVLFDMIKKGE